jgi:hypothetical protein
MDAHNDELTHAQIAAIHRYIDAMAARYRHAIALQAAQSMTESSPRDPRSAKRQARSRRLQGFFHWILTSEPLCPPSAAGFAGAGTPAHPAAPAATANTVTIIDIDPVDEGGDDRPS